MFVHMADYLLVWQHILDHMKMVKKLYQLRSKTISNLTRTLCEQIVEYTPAASIFSVVFSQQLMLLRGMFASYNCTTLAAGFANKALACWHFCSQK